MIYPDDFEIKLGFNHIRQYIKSNCSFVLSKDMVDAISFSTDFSSIRKKLLQISEMKGIILSFPDLPRPTLYNIVTSLKSIKIEGSHMPIEQLTRLSSMLNAINSVKTFYCRRNEEDAYFFPHLSESFSSLQSFPLIERELKRCINKFGGIADNASDNLYTIRKSLASANIAVSKALNRAFDKARTLGVVDKDTTPSVREGRMVIPVSASHKRSLSGIVHDESASGKTVYIEPMEVIEASNRLRELQLEEQREIIVILTHIADIIRPHINDLKASVYILAEMDFIMAKAKFAIEIGGNMPKLESYPVIDWYGAVHPVLLTALRQQDKTVVPLTLNLDKQHRFLMVSGPNAGGKSVVLKTVGIVQYMTQCGVLPTLFENSHVGIFSDIFVDIGDEQSIENDLSTYSSHLKNMKYFVKNASNGSLLLADEIGSGTEPQIGSALAQSILNKLSKSNCFGIVTTHYQNLKQFAEDAEGFVNGAMEYNRQMLKPTFRLTVGNPGSSFAIDIAGKIGLPKDIIDEAKEIVGSEYINADKYILDIERDKRYWANKRQSIKEKERKLDTLLARYEDTSASLQSQRKAIINDAKKEAEEIIRNANARIEAAIREIRDIQAEKEKTKIIRKELADYKSSLSDDSASKIPDVLTPLKHKSKEIRRKQSVKPDDVDAAKLSVGDYVKLNDGGTSGKILSINGNNAEVAFGDLRTKVNIKKLQPASKPKQSAKSTQYSISSSTSDDSRSRQLNFKTEIDVRGMRGDEAVQAVTYFLDDAIQFSIPKIRILHGTGHGILKTLIREQLNVNTAVRSFHDEDVRFGGAGITVVELDT